MGNLSFTKEEDSMLRELYPICKRKELELKLNRSWDEIICRARYLKIPYGQPCVLCGKMCKKERDGLFVCSDCYYTSGGTCELCGRKCNPRARYCYACAKKVVGDKNRKHDDVFCKSCNKKISFLNKVPYCRTCAKRLKIGKIWHKCLNCGTRFAVSKYRHNVGKGKFCSPRCKHDYRSNNIDSFKKKFKFVSKIGDIITMRSSWEVKFAEYLDNNNIEFQFEPHSIETSYGKYYPDFYLPQTKSYVEIKGYFTKIAKNKYDEAVSKSYPITVIDKKALQSLGILS